MTDPGRAIWRTLAAAMGRLRTEGAVAVGLTVAALAPVGLLVAWAVGDWGPKGIGPLALWGALAVAAVALLVVLGRRWVRDVDERAVAAAAERARELPEGSLRGIVELGRELPPGSSAALFHRAESVVAARLAGSTAVELAGDLGHRARRRWSRLLAGVAGLVLVAGAAGFAAPDRAQVAWRPLLHPVEHLRGPTYPALVVTPGDTAVDRGGMLDIAIEARLRQRVTLHSRSMGDVPQEHSLSVESGRAAATIGPVAAAVSYWVEAPDGAVTDTFTVTPRDPLMATDLSVDLVYPRHVDRAPDHYRGEPPPLRVPEGTRLRVAGRASRELVAAEVRRDDGSERRATVAGSGFEVGWTLTPGSGGRWDLVLVSDDGTRAPTAAGFDIEVVEDGPPRVRIAVPGADTLMPSSLRQPIVAEAIDDHGLTAGQLVFRRVGADGERGAAVSVDLPLSGTAGRGSLRGILDASAHPLIAGDAIEYHVTVRDNSPGRQIGRSRTYTLRLPAMSELRDRARQRAEDVLDETRSLGERARELEAGTRDLRRSGGRQGAAQRPGSRGRNDAAERQLGYEEAVEARDVAADHEEVLSRVDELETALAELERALEEAGLSDPELRRRLQELRGRQTELASPELRDQVQALRDAAEALDPEAVRAALERLAAEQERFRERVEESLQMMRRAAAEQELNALAREADEIAGREMALAEALRDEAGPGPGEEDVAAEGEVDTTTGDVSESGEQSGEQSGEESAEESGEGAEPEHGRELPSLPKPPSVSLDRATQQDELEGRADRLNRALEALQQQLAQMGEQESSTQAGEAKAKGKASQQSMQQAAEEARQQQGSRAAQSAQRAAGEMSEAARALDAAREQMAASQQRAAQEAVQQATQEALGMAQRQESLRQEMAREQRQGGASGESLQQMRSDQAALQQGLQQLSRNLSQTDERSGMIDPEVARALERARMNMDRTVQGLEDARRMPVGEAGRTVESLNELAMSLLENEAGMQQAMGSSGVEEALRRLSQTAQEQGALNGRVSALDPMRLSEQARSRQLQQLGQEQRGLARQIGEASGALGGREDVLGRLDQLSAEAARLAQELEGGRLDPEIIQRQERLFHRLLDAGRSLEREEYSDERLGRSAVGVESTTPGALQAELLDPRIRYPAPTAEQLERLPPAYRRLILDYFDRLNRSAVEVSEGAEQPEENRSGAEPPSDASGDGAG